MATLLHSVVTGVLLAGGLLGPGWLLGRACRLRVGFVGAFLGSAAILLNLVLVLDALGVAISHKSLAAGLGLLGAALALVGRKNLSLANPRSPITAPDPRRWQRHHWYFLSAALGLGAIGLRATLDPLSGFDTLFRWDFLAHQMIREGGLRFYPAVTGEDFLHYGWPDGIAPLVSVLYAWAYLAANNAAAGVTAPIVIAQGLLLFLAVWQLAARKDRSTAALACALLAASSVLLWGTAMGQETGLTALSVIAMFLFIERHREDPAGRWLWWAGLAAGVGALAREYGFAYLALGVFALARHRTPLRRWLQFIAAALVVAAPWYLRNALKTGNPLYSHDLAGLFPVNPLLMEYNELAAAQFAPGAPESSWPRLAALALGLGGAPLVLGALGALRRWRETTGLVSLAVLTGLWLVSLGKTSAGPGYAVRVLTPAVALGAVLGAQWLASWKSPWLHRLLPLGLGLLAIDAGLRSLYLPVEAEVRWWQRDAGSWRDFGRDAEKWRAHPNWAAIADAAGGRAILTPDPTTHALFVRLGAKAAPLFSPEVRFLFAPEAELQACFTRLRAQGLRFILLTRTSALNDAQAERHPFFRALRATPPTAVFSHYLIYDLSPPGK